MPGQESQRSPRLRVPILALLISSAVVGLATVSFFEFPTLMPPVLSTLIVFLGSVVSICSFIVVLLRVARTSDVVEHVRHTRLPGRAILGLITCLVLVNGLLLYFCHTSSCAGFFVVANTLTPTAWFIGRRAAVQAVSRKA